MRQAEMYGECIVAPESNNFGAANMATKPHMLMDLRKPVEHGMLELSDPDLIAELRAYTRDDLMDRDEGTCVRLTTRHFDLLIACAIAWQMRSFATRSYWRNAAYSESTQGSKGRISRCTSRFRWGTNGKPAAF